MSLIEEANAAVSHAMVHMKTLTVVLKNLQKENVKLVKNAEKNKRKKKGGGGDHRMPAGFCKPNVLSEELCAFLGVERGSQYTRNEISKRVFDYVREHGLQKPTDRKMVVLNDEMKKLFYITTDADADEDMMEIPLFHMQKYINHHLIPQTTTATTATTGESVNTSAAAGTAAIDMQTYDGEDEGEERGEEGEEKGGGEKGGGN